MTQSEYQQLVEFLGPRFDQIDARFGEVDARVHQVDRRLDTVEAQISALRHDMLGHFDAIYRRLERLEQEYQAITQALRRIEALLADEQGRHAILERDLAELKQHVAGLQQRIDELELRLRG